MQSATGGAASTGSEAMVPLVVITHQGNGNVPVAVKSPGPVRYLHYVGAGCSLSDAEASP
jgi:hypothetical protein